MIPLSIRKSIVSVVVVLSAFFFMNSANASILKSYDFDGGLSDTLGFGVDLTASGGTVSGGRYSFLGNQGLRLTSALASTTDYGIEFRFRMDTQSGYNKLIDFQDLSSDLGLYELSGTLNFYTLGSGGSGMTTGTDYTVGIARSGGTVELFLDGGLVYSALDGGGQAVSSGNILNFFEDDYATSQGESFAGSVDYIRIHDDSSTFGQSPVPEPTSFIVWSFLGLAAFRIRRRHS